MGIFLARLSFFRSEVYNRVDKINMNNTNIVSPEKVGGHFQYADSVKQPHTRQLDDLHKEQEGRHVGNVYMPVKGKSKNQGQVDQLKSSIGVLVKQEKGIDWTNKNTQKNVNFDRDRRGNDIFGFSNMTESTAPVGKKTMCNHPHNQHNGNFLHWET